MTRPQLIEELARQEASTFYNMPKERSAEGAFFQHVQEFLDRLSPLIPEWLPISDCKKPGEYLVAVLVEGEYAVVRAAFEGIVWVFRYGNERFMINPEYFMELPPPPGKDPIQSLLK